MRIQLVWYKRDLRVEDHGPLFYAAQQGQPLLPLYIIEPSRLQAPDFDPADWKFVAETLQDLRRRLANLGQPLVVRVGETIPILHSLAQQFDIAAIWAHQETTNLRGYDRDRSVRNWARNQGIDLKELPNNGIVRGLKDRDAWEEIREKRMRAPLLPVPAALQPVPLVPGRIPDGEQLRLGRSSKEVQAGGAAAGSDLLQSFLDERGCPYVTAMSSPQTAAAACSRLSPHLAYGTLSVRQAVQAVRHRRQAVRQLPVDEATQTWAASLGAFESRLAWRDHFIQKIEMQPDIQTHNLVRSYDGLRDSGGAGQPKRRLEAWKKGETGYPMVDACMRSLLATGWLNFRMRAMLVSFAAHDLWLDWTAFGAHLGRAFLDYEPGIHYSQLQMQSGTSGSRTLRIYDPTKQGVEFDPQGTFIRRWVPELAAVPDSFVHAPHLLPPLMQRTAGFQLGRDYPAPIVDHARAAAAARERIAAVRQDPIAIAETHDVRQKHGSRRAARLSQKKRPPRKKQGGPQQLKLDIF